MALGRQEEYENLYLHFILSYPFKYFECCIVYIMVCILSQDAIYKCTFFWKHSNFLGKGCPQRCLFTSLYDAARAGLDQTWTLYYMLKPHLAARSAGARLEPDMWAPKPH